MGLKDPVFPPGPPAVVETIPPLTGCEGSNCEDQ